MERPKNIVIIGAGYVACPLRMNWNAFIDQSFVLSIGGLAFAIKLKQRLPHAQFTVSPALAAMLYDLFLRCLGLRKSL